MSGKQIFQDHRMLRRQLVGARPVEEKLTATKKKKQQQTTTYKSINITNVIERMTRNKQSTNTRATLTTTLTSSTP